MHKVAWQALFRAVPINDVLNGNTLHFGQHLALLYQELNLYDWPRETAPLTLKEVERACLTDINPLPRECQRPNSKENGFSDDVMMVWLLLHTNEERERIQIIHWLFIICAARFAARNANSGSHLGTCLLRNAADYYTKLNISAPPTLDCFCDRSPAARFTQARKPSADVLKSPVQTLTPSTGSPAYPSARHSVSGASTGYKRTDIATADSAFDSGMLIRSSSLQTDKQPASPNSRALLTSLRHQITLMKVDYCEELFRAIQALYGWSLRTLMKFYELSTQWHIRISSRRAVLGAEASPESSAHRVRLRAMTDTPKRIQMDLVELQRCRRRDVLLIIYGVIKLVAPVLNSSLCLPSDQRVRASFEAASEIKSVLKALHISKLSKLIMTGSTLDHSMKSKDLWRLECIRRLSDVIHSEDSREFTEALCCELRQALLCVCGSGTDIYCLGWVDVMSVNIIEALDVDPSIHILWLRQRWLALPNILKLYECRFAIHTGITYANSVNRVFRQYAPADSIEPAAWLERVLNRMHNNEKLFEMNDPLMKSDDDTTRERLSGLAAVTCEFGDVQKSKSHYWMHIHPLIGHLIDPNYSDSQKIVTIPFTVHESHLPIFRSIMFELMMKSNAGPPEFCSAYVDSIIYSAFREACPSYCAQSLEMVNKARAQWLYKLFEEFIFFHESCIPTKFMLDARPQYYAEEFIRYSGDEYLALNAAQALQVIRTLAKSSKFIDELAKRRAITIELV